MRTNHFLPLFVGVPLMATMLAAAVDSKEATVIAKIEKLGGKVIKDEESPGSPVFEVDFRGNKKITNNTLALLKDFPELTTLILTNTKISDGGLKELKHLPNLTTLEVDGTKITDAGLKEIGYLENLSSLDLTATQITDAALLELRVLKNLNTLHLRFIENVTGSGTDALLNALPDLDIHR